MVPASVTTKPPLPNRVSRAPGCAVNVIDSITNNTSEGRNFCIMVYFADIKLLFPKWW
jgi:hypothetical protein